MDERIVAHERIVVGVDGSSDAARALRWAADEARLRGARLEVVHAWSYPYEGHLGEVASEAMSGMDFEHAAAKVVATMVDEALAPAGRDGAGVTVEEKVVEEAPARALLQAAEGADLLVVGSRGKGGFLGLLLGSVSQQCAHHTTCPLVIVPSPST